MQPFDTQWSATIIAMQKQSGEELFETLYCRQLETFDQRIQLVALYIHDTVQKIRTEELHGIEKKKGW